VVAVAEPTSMTWLGLHVALQRAGCDLSLVGTRHAARLRGAISGKRKSDVIAADVLPLASDVFELSPLDPPQAAQLDLVAVGQRLEPDRAVVELTALPRAPRLDNGNTLSTARVRSKETTMKRRILGALAASALLATSLVACSSGVKG